LFGYVNGGEIREAGISDSVITGASSVGAIAGYIENMQMKDCFTTATVTVNAVYENAGGLVGSNNTGGAIISCYNKAAVNGGDNVGGLVGVAYNSLIQDCYSNGNITGNQNLGGLIGLMYENALLNVCYTTGTVSGYEYIGGLVGKSETDYYSAILNCVALNPELNAVMGEYFNRIIGDGPVTISGAYARIDMLMNGEATAIGGLGGEEATEYGANIGPDEYYSAFWWEGLMFGINWDKENGRLPTLIYAGGEQIQYPL
jgi:hypothetical protein